MNQSIFQFGEVRSEFQVPVLNERAIRASAGILFMLGLVAFMNAWLMGNFRPTQVFVVAFLIEFSLRLFVNPRYAPVLTLGQWMVRRQQPEWTGAAQKRFAWGIGFVLAALMFYLMVLNQVIGPINMLTCSACLTLLFFETAFGICVGCKIYNMMYRDRAQLCPGGTCEMPADAVPKLSSAQVLWVVAFALLMVAVAQWVYGGASSSKTDPGHTSAHQAKESTDPAEAERCKVPEFAKAIGHEAKWKQHNNCN